MNAPERDFPHATLRAVIDRIIPADAWPSASENRADDYILRITENEMSHWRTTLGQWLDALDAQARRYASLPFAQLPAQMQDEMLAAIENDSTRRPGFEMLIRLTNEGYYADRTNGGNPDHISWEMIGYEPRLPPGAI